ncbi:MAG: LamB/YcsF family protein [Mycobacteriaceae bacterium]|nr:LamB/YcsF family protein [Mycobacteriaceae bacterium]NBQ42534.1 LamB/YcsF family protein [Mycobacteriaceae bacterium]
MASVDLNADLGEGFGVWRLGDDDAMLGIVTSANLACGFHAGNPVGLARTCRAAADRGVRIGAQVGYFDLAGFGRRRIDVEPEELRADVIYQIGALQAMARAAGATLGYVKPHGALYNTITVEQEQARAVAAAVHAVDPGLPVLGLAGSAFFAEAKRLGLRTVAEVFADRAYLPDGQLVPRHHEGAVLREPEEIADRVAVMVRAGQVSAIDGSMIDVDAKSICVHGDSPGAVQIATAVRRRLEAEGVTLEAFA